MNRRGSLISLVMAVSVLMVGLSSIARAAGDTLSQFITKELDDAIRVHFFEPDYINWSRNTPPDNLIPENKSKRTSVRPTVSFGELGKTLECNEIRLASWNDWQAEVKKHEHNHNQNWVSYYQYWNSPSYAKVRASHKFIIWQDWPVKVSIAIIGNDFDIYQIFDRGSGGLRDDILERMKMLSGRAYFSGRGNLLDDSVMEIVDKTKCSGFSIFDLIFRKND